MPSLRHLQELLGGANVNIHIFSTTMVHINGDPIRTAKVRDGTAKKFYNESDFDMYKKKGYFVHLDDFTFVYFERFAYFEAIAFGAGSFVKLNFPVP